MGMLLSILLAASPLPDAPALQKKTARFAPVDLTADLTSLPPNERQALARILEAAELVDAIFLRQAWSGNEAMLLSLLRDGSPLGRERLHAFLLHRGPWDSLDQDAAFIPGSPPRPPQGGYYPEDATREQVEVWIKSLPPKQRAQATGFFTTVRRDPAGKLTLVPYSTEYQGELIRAAAKLREAAALTAQPTLKAFLEKRAAAFLSNDYYDSDVAWMQLDASIEPTIGPYEVYGDGWFNYKAAFEAFIALRDEEETRKLQKFSAQLQDIENHLPIDPRLRNPKLGALAPIRVVSSIFSAGDANHGVQTAAYNLPNDERVTAKMGSKRVMLKNVQEAKFQKVLVPISRIALAAADQGSVAFDAFFTHILMHELMHGLGPHDIRVGGTATTVRQALQETSSALEEAKADISGLFALQHLVDRGQIDKGMERTMYVTFLASAFRSIRFGLNDAHGRGLALQLNSLLDRGAVRVNADGTFALGELAKVKEAVAALTGEIMTVQAAGDRAKAKALLDRLGVIRPEVQRVIDRMAEVPVDIEPRYVTAAQLRAELAGPAAAR